VIKKPSVLLVDNKQSSIKILVTYLCDDFDVIVCLRSEEALNIIKKERIDLILLDVIMPRMDGFEISKKINEVHKFKIPIIFVTASNSIEDIKKGFELGAVDYIIKPFRKIEILERLKIHIQLQDYKNNLEEKVKKEIEKNKLKEKIMFHQSRLISMGEMINSIAHQWRQPLSSINSAVVAIDALLFKKGILENKDINANLEDIEKQTRYMSRTIEDFSNFLNPNKIKGAYLLKNLVTQSLSILNSKLSNNNIACHIEDLNASYIYCYEGEIIQVILVIINNAIDALKQNDIKNPLINITTDENHILIKDNAGGIKQENIDDVFLPYFSTKKGKNGLGIGLYVAKTIVEESNNGKILVYNNSKGACFCINLPKDKLNKKLA